MIPTYTTSVGLPKICLAFDWPTQMKIPRTAPGYVAYQISAIRCPGVTFHVIGTLYLLQAFQMEFIAQL